MSHEDIPFNLPPISPDDNPEQDMPVPEKIADDYTDDEKLRRIGESLKGDEIRKMLEDYLKDSDAPEEIKKRLHDNLSGKSENNK